jgi:cellulase
MKGPIVAYLAPAASNGKGNVWVKIAEENFSNGQWPVDRLKANGGKHDVKIPVNLAAGDYIFRTEILALHESDTLFSANSARGIQLCTFYRSTIALQTHVS